MPCPEIKLDLPKIRLHKRQQLLVFSPSRFTIGTCGRRFGKTLGLLIKLAMAACKYHKSSNVLYWWCAPTYARASKAFDDFERAMRSIVKRASREDYSITLHNNVRIEFVSLKEWQNRKGDGLDGVIVDEAARCPSKAWYELIYPALMDKRGWAVMISTPLGRNWFYKEFMKGDMSSDTYDPDYTSYKFPSHDNPYLDIADIEKARKDLPEDLYRQEIMAEFLIDGAGVFLGLKGLEPTQDELIRGFGIIEPVFVPQRVYAGFDFGKHQDFSVFHLVGTFPGFRPQTIWWERFTKLDWKDQFQRIKALHEKFNIHTATLDSSGGGDSVYEQVRDNLRIPRVIPFKFSSPSNRQALYKNLQVAVSGAVWSVPLDGVEDMPVFWDEHRAFEYHLTDAGKLTMGPPDGEHDDSVAAHALLAHSVLQDSSNGDFTEFAPKNQAKIILELAQNGPQDEDAPIEVQDRSGSPFQADFASPFGGAGYFGG